METNEHKGKIHLYLDWREGIFGIRDSGWDLVFSIFPVDALKSLAVCTKLQY